MTQYIKILVIYILRIVLRLFYILPVNERKIVFISWEGKQYACNPKYIFEYMYNFYADKYIYVWSLKNKEKQPNIFSNVQICGYLTPDHFYTMMTAKYIITNFTIEPCFPLRKNQIVIYTWHGVAYKRISDIEIYKKRRWSMSIMRDIRSKMINYVISSCEEFTKIFHNIWNISQSKFLPIGMPRNDILFSHNDSIRDKVCKHYNITNDKKIVLYAPTYRGDFRAPNNVDFLCNLNIENILKSLKSKYGKDFLFLYRAHYRINLYLENKPNVISASDYPDMQELLYAADILITDYSSSMWDFSLTFKPCFIFALDLKKYQEEQGFYTPIEEWPFPVAETNEQLIENINNFNEEKYKQAVGKHHADLGSYENGTACEQFCRFVFSVH
jgi:CDP-glycerol glycerophosphotransferase